MTKMRKNKEEKIQKKYFQLRRLASLNRMVDRDHSHELNAALDRKINKLEIGFPGLVEFYSLA